MTARRRLPLLALALALMGGTGCTSQQRSTAPERAPAPAPDSGLTTPSSPCAAVPADLVGQIVPTASPSPAGDLAYPDRIEVTCGWVSPAGAAESLELRLTLHSGAGPAAASLATACAAPGSEPVAALGDGACSRQETLGLRVVGQQGDRVVDVLARSGRPAPELREATAEVLRRALAG